MALPTNGQKDAAGNTYVPGSGFIKNLQWDASGAGRGTMPSGMEWSSGPGLQSMLAAGAGNPQGNKPAPMPTPAPAPAAAATPTPAPAPAPAPAATTPAPAAMSAAPVLQPPPPPGPGWAPTAPGALNPNLGKRSPRESMNALAGMAAKGAY